MIERALKEAKAFTTGRVQFWAIEPETGDVDDIAEFAAGAVFRKTGKPTTGVGVFLNTLRFDRVGGLRLDVVHVDDSRR